MSLLDYLASPCAIMIKIPESDGEGGIISTWKEGPHFDVYQLLDSSMEARIAEKQGVTSVYTAAVKDNVSINHNDYYRNLETGNTYRVTSDPEEKVVPSISSLPVKLFSVEKRALPQ